MSIVVNKFKQISTDPNVPNTGVNRLLKIYTFSTTNNIQIGTNTNNQPILSNEEAIIINGLKQVETKAYFSDVGDILITNSAGSQVYYFLNKLATKNLTYNQTTQQYELPPNQTRTLSNESNLVSLPSTLAEPPYLVVSKPYGNYYLYKKDSATPMVLLYNTIPRPEYIDFYNGDIQAYGLVADYCKEVNKADPVCLCINQENANASDTTENKQFCMNSIFKTNAARAAVKAKATPYEYSEISKRCGCFNTECSQTHPFHVKDRLIKLPPNGECPASNYTICSVQIGAGRDVDFDNLQLEQKCGSDSGPTTPPPTTPPPTTAPPAKKSSPILFIIIGIVVLIAIIFFVLKKKK